MHCFNHPNHEAAAVCSNCGRGLCSECFTLSEDAIACRDRCEQAVATLQHNRRKYNTLMRGTYRGIATAGVFCVAIGAVNIWLGRELELLTYVGAIFTAFGIATIIRGLKTASTFQVRETSTREDASTRNQFR